MAAHRKAVSIAVAAAAAALLATPAGAELATPTPVSPAMGASAQSLPAFAWNAVPGADRYEFQLAADAGFNSPVLGRGEDQFFTRNARATLKKTIPNGTYWWRVRAVAKDGSVSKWAEARSFRKAWTAAPALQTPSQGAVVSHPSAPLVLRWSSVPYAAKYLVTIATDPMLGSAVGALQNIETSGTNFAPSGVLLPPGTYYWGVTPIDAQGHRGAPSPVASFSWTWPTSTSPSVGDLLTAPEVFDPFFSWSPVPGAAKYDLEVNSSSDWATGSKVCCSDPIIGSSLSPTKNLKDNTYYWRVRAIDAWGNAGSWNVGATFAKVFDKVPPVPSPSVKNVRMRDNLADPGTDELPATPGHHTYVPIITWDPVPGASSYEVDVFPYEDGACDWSDGDFDHWHSVTTTTAWTPLGSGWNGVKPYADPRGVANEVWEMLGGKGYCARVRARADRDTANGEVYGDYTYLDDTTGKAFTWLGRPTGTACTPSCVAGYLGSDDYKTPITGSTATRMPLFTWDPLPGKMSYFVLVAKDPSFSNLVDYGFTWIPAYAPRNMTQPTSYPDETTLYYWAVLPANNDDGSGAAGNPLDAAPRNFQKQTVPPSLVQPVSGSDVIGQPVFQWTSAEAARRYRLQVSHDPAFGTLLDDVTTASTSYTSNTSYPADTVLYWRVRADDENLVGLRWSATGSFQRRLPSPSPRFDAPAGEMFPVISWDPVPGAVSYRVAVDEGDGDHREYDDFRSAAATFVKMTGTGVTGVRVRANFPTKTTLTTPGPWSSTIFHTRTIGEPTGAAMDTGPSHVVISWNAKPGAKSYRVQISQREDFAQLVEDVTTDNSSFAPALTHPQYLQGGTFFWRVTAVDEDRNVGDFTRAQSFRLAAGSTLRVTQRLRLRLRSGRLRAKRLRRVVFNVSAAGKPVRGALVRPLGGGLRTRARATNARGQVIFRLRPKRRGVIAFHATKRGYSPAILPVRVR